jgi:hypothetical protein
VATELHRIWNRFKKVATDSRLATFERTIQDIDRFEELRYPDKMFTKKGPLLFQFELRRIDLDNVLALDKTLDRPPVRRVQPRSGAVSSTTEPKGDGSWRRSCNF